MNEWNVFEFLTSTVEGVVFVEWLLVLGVGLLYREMWAGRQALKDHETGCAARAVQEAEWRGQVNTRLDGIDSRLERGEKRFDALETGP